MSNEEILKKAIEKANGKANWDIEKLMIDELYYSIIFSHAFAKAFWGIDWMPIEDDGNQYHKWEHHLRQMVLEQNPLKYLERFI